MLVICPKKLFIGTEISGSLFTSLSNHNDYGDGNDDYGDSDNDDDAFHLVTSILMVIIMATVMMLLMMVMILVMNLV